MYPNFRIAVEYTEELDVKSIYYALQNMIYQHPSFSMNAYHKEAYFYMFPYHFKLMQSYKLSDVLQVIDDPSLTIDAIFNKLNDVYFHYGTKKPLWSLILLNKKTLIYYSDHLLFDGTSGLNFHKVFAQCLKETKNCKENNDFDKDKLDSILFDVNNIDDEFQLAPKPSELIDYSVPISYILYFVMITCFPKLLTTFIKYYFIDEAAISKSRTYNMIPLPKKMIKLNRSKDQCKLVNIPQDKLKLLIGGCRKHAVKLTSLLVVMSLLAISRVTGAENDTMVLIPVNSRNKIKNSVKDDFGLYLGDLSMELPPVEKTCNNGEINWNIVKYINDYIHNNLSSSQNDLGLTSLVDTKVFLEQRKKIDKDKLIATLLVSNLGKLEIEKGNDEVFENAYFDQPCRSGILSLFSMNVISTQRGGAELSLHSVDSSWLETYNEGIKFQLSKF